MQISGTLNTQTVTEVLTRASQATFATESRRREALAALREHLTDCTCGQRELVAEGQCAEIDRSDQDLVERLIQAVDSAILAT